MSAGIRTYMGDARSHWEEHARGGNDKLQGSDRVSKL
jgi:hypothetical protein